MKTLRRLLSPVLILVLCFTLIIGSACAFFAVRGDAINETVTLGHIDIDWSAAPDSFFTGFDSATGESSPSVMRFANRSTHDARFMVYFVPVWQEETSPGSGLYTDLPLPVDNVNFKVNGVGVLDESTAGHIYECTVPKDLADFSLEITAMVSDADLYAGKSLKVNVYFDAAVV